MLLESYCLSVFSQKGLRILERGGYVWLGECTFVKSVTFFASIQQVVLIREEL